MGRRRLGGMPGRSGSDSLSVSKETTWSSNANRLVLAAMAGSQVKVLPAESNPASGRRRTAGPTAGLDTVIEQEQRPKVADLDHRALLRHRPHCPAG